MPEARMSGMPGHGAAGLVSGGVCAQELTGTLKKIKDNGSTTLGGHAPRR